MQLREDPGTTLTRNLMAVPPIARVRGNDISAAPLNEWPLTCGRA